MTHHCTHVCVASGENFHSQGSSWHLHYVNLKPKDRPSFKSSMSLIIDFINLSILKKLLCFSPISHIRDTSVMLGCRIPVFYSEFSAKYLKTLEICQLQARESFISTSKFSQEGLCSRCQRRAQGGKDRVEQGAGMNDFKPLGELRADPVPMKSFSIVSLHKMFGSKPAVRLGCFCARLLLRGQCMTAALHIQNKELQKFFPPL